MKRRIGFLLILIGLALFGVYKQIPQVAKQISSAKVIETLSAQQLQKNDEDTEFVNDFESVSELSVGSILSDTHKVDRSKIISQLMIPDTGLVLPIVKGTTQETLLLGATTMKPDQKLGEGNYTLAGHFSYEKNVYFADVYNLKMGTLIYLTDKNHIYTYKMVDRIVVPNTRLDMLSDERMTLYENKPILSLMTCNTPVTVEERVFVIGVLMDKKPWDGTFKP